MMMCNQTNPGSKLKTDHCGFTLVELLVVISILLALTGIVVLFFPSMQEQARAARGAAMLQGWLQVAKTRALRDQAPRGLRLLISGNLVTQAQYIEQPDDFFGGLNSDILVANPTDPPGNNPISVVKFYPPSPLPVPYNPINLSNIQTGDYLEVGGGGEVHSINGVGANSLTLNSPIPYPILNNPGTLSSNYRIIRAPRLADDEILQLPTDVGILTTVELFPPTPINPVTPTSRLVNIGISSLNNIHKNLAGNNIDIMFAPSGSVLPALGAVVSNPINYDTICLWVRDITAASPLLGEPTLIGVHVRSGLIVAHPVNPSDYFSFVRDGRSSGK